MTERAEHQRKAIYNVKPIKTKKGLEDFRSANLGRITLERVKE